MDGRKPRSWSSSFARVGGPPLGFVAIDVAADLCGALAEASGVRRELVDLAGVVEGVAAVGECGAELRVAHDGGVADAVEGFDGVDDADGVEATPSAAREDAGVDLEVEVSVRVAGAGSVVLDECGLELLDWDLDLPTARADARGRVLRDPADDLPGGLGLASGDVVAGDPAFVARAVEVGASFGAPAVDADGDGVVLGDAAALGEVVVVGAGVVGLDVGARGGCGPAVELHSTVHDVPVTARHVSSTTPEMTLVRPRGDGPSTALRSMRAARFRAFESPYEERVIGLVRVRQSLSQELEWIGRHQSVPMG